jgi:hypothetical protein
VRACIAFLPSSREHIHLVSVSAHDPQLDLTLYCAVFDRPGVAGGHLENHALQSEIEHRIEVDRARQRDANRSQVVSASCSRRTVPTLRPRKNGVYSYLFASILGRNTVMDLAEPFVGIRPRSAQMTMAKPRRIEMMLAKRRDEYGAHRAERSR